MNMHLDGIRIISFNHYLMGPLGIQFLADLGAEVIAIEPPEGGFQRHWGPAASRRAGGETALGLVANRNKQSVCLNLKDPAAIEIAHKLIASADVVAENFRPGVMDRLQLGYDVLRKIKPDIIYAAATGFGATGPYANRPGQDLIAQSISGLTWITSRPGETPRPVGTSAIDHHGAMIFAAGILAALVKRVRTGEGGRVDVNLLSAALNLQAESLVTYFNGETPGDIRQPEHLGSWYHEAPYGIYATSDSYIALSLGSLDALHNVLGAPVDEDITQDQTFHRREEVAHSVAAALRKQKFDHWRDLFTTHKIWFAEVNDYEGVRNDPQIDHNGDFVSVKARNGEDVTLISHPVRYDGEAPPVTLPPQEIGAQTVEVLTSLGYSSQAIADLTVQGAVGARTEMPASEPAVVT